MPTEDTITQNESDVINNNDGSDSALTTQMFVTIYYLFSIKIKNV